MKSPSLISLRFIIILIISSLVSSIFVIVRIIWSHTPFYGFMIWNLFLAWLPLIFIYGWKKVRERYSILSGMFLGLWFLFFPNAPYIVTDLFHFYYRDPIPLWYDLVMLMNCAWLGLILGYSSLYEVQEWLRTKISAVYSWIVIGIVLLLSGGGIYIGRYLRFNSWDLVISPFQTFFDIVQTFVTTPRAWGATIVFSIFLIMTYVIFRSLVGVKASAQLKR